MVYDSVSTFHTPACVNLQTKHQLKNLTNPVAAINKNVVKCLHLKKPVPNDAQCLQFSFYFPSTFYKPGNSLTPVHITWKAPGIFFFSLQFKFLSIHLQRRRKSGKCVLSDLLYCILVNRPRSHLLLTEAKHLVRWQRPKHKRKEKP